MHFTPALLSILPLALAAPLAERQTSSSAFGVIAARSTSPIHLQSVQANGRAFWIQKETTTYCPSPTVDCSGFENSTTIFAVQNGGTTASLYTSVPGGQQVYVEKCGALGFTGAHSAAIPEGAYVEGFSYTPNAQDATQPGSFSFHGGGATGFLACPEDGAYRVYADTVDAVLDSACLGFSALTGSWTGSSAWQYTK